MSYNTTGPHLADKFYFSKTQKLDLKEANKMMMRETNTDRELSNENKNNSLSPNRQGGGDDKQHYANLLK